MVLLDMHAGRYRVVGSCFLLARLCPPPPTSVLIFQFPSCCFPSASASSNGAEGLLVPGHRQTTLGKSNDMVHDDPPQGVEVPDSRQLMVDLARRQHLERIRPRNQFVNLSPMLLAVTSWQRQLFLQHVIYRLISSLYEAVLAISQHNPSSAYLKDE